MQLKRDRIPDRVRLCPTRALVRKRLPRRKSLEDKTGTKTGSLITALASKAGIEHALRSSHDPETENMLSDIGSTGDRKRSSQRIGAFINPAWRSMSHENANLQRDLDQVLGRYLDTGRIRIALTGRTLVIACRDRAGALEIRFLLRDLRKTLDALGYHNAENLKVVVETTAGPVGLGRENPNRRRIPESAVRTLVSVANTVPDEGLAAALRRLARLGSREDTSR